MTRKIKEEAKLYTCPLGMEFILCPAGKFMMGSQAEVAHDWEKPIHEVTLTKPFYIGKYPVTQAQWEAVMGSNPSDFKGKDNPVEMVSWEDAQEFIKKLNKKGDANFYRLPTEAEWEYAARAGTQTEYFWGEDESKMGEYAWFRDNSGFSTHPVGRKKANPWGLHDIYGNVWEWVEDYWSDYTAASCKDPRGPSSGAYRVLRGGSWSYNAWHCRSAYRNTDSPSLRLNLMGLRLALSPE